MSLNKEKLQVLNKGNNSTNSSSDNSTTTDNTDQKTVPMYLDINEYPDYNLDIYAYNTADMNFDVNHFSEGVVSTTNMKKKSTPLSLDEAKKELALLKTRVFGNSQHDTKDLRNKKNTIYSEKWLIKQLKLTRLIELEHLIANRDKLLKLNR